MKTITNILLGLVLSISQIKTAVAAEINIAVAASFAPALFKIADNFEKASQHKTKIIIGSSGALTTKIINGAPFDIFLSANTSYPQKLYEKKLGEEQPLIYAQGSLVLWSLKEKKDFNLKNINDIKNNDFKTIAIASKRHAPYGQAATEVLDKYKLYTEIKNKLVFGESISQVNQFIITQTADAGFVPKSMVIAYRKGQFVEIPASTHNPIKQAMIMLTGKKSDKYMAAKEFISFMQSEKAKKIINNFGYLNYE